MPIEQPLGSVPLADIADLICQPSSARPTVDTLMQKYDSHADQILRALCDLRINTAVGYSQV
jgi:hypothetical protein